MSKVIRILQIGMTCNIGGLETYLIQQFKHLDNARVVYDFVNNNAGKNIAFEKYITDNNGKVYNIVARKTNPLKHYYQWIKLLYRKRNEIHGIVLNSLGLTYVFSLLIGKIMNYPIRIIHSHNSNYEIELGIFRKSIIFFNKIILRFSLTDRFACSKKAGDWMFGNEKYKIIHNAIDSKEFIFDEKTRMRKREEFNFLESDYIVGHVGRFSEQKNHEFIIELFKELANIDKSSKLLLIGGLSGNGDSSYLDRTRRKVKDYCLEDRVIFCGLREDVNELMQAMDCFILPSKFEGLPVTGVEIQAAGVPCVFSDVITEEVAITDDVVFMSLNESPMEWAKKILSMKKCKRKNRFKEIVAAGYDINTEIEKIMEYYEHNINHGCDNK